jgi:Rieske Fe-S protein
LKVLAGCATAAVAAVGVVPAVAFVTEPGREGPVGEIPWMRVLRLDALEPARPAKVAIVGAEVDAWARSSDRWLGAVWLIRDDEATVRAYSAVCPHLGCTIELAQDHFVCPCHDSDFDFRGDVLTGPSPRGMDPIPVQIAEGWVSVRYQRFRQGTPERIPV